MPGNANSKQDTKGEEPEDEAAADGVSTPKKLSRVLEKVIKLGNVYKIK